MLTKHITDIALNIIIYIVKITFPGVLLSNISIPQLFNNSIKTLNI